MSESLRPAIEATIAAFVANNTQAVKTKDASLLSAVLATDCVRRYRPQSFVRRHAAFFRAALSNAEYEAQMRVELQSMADVEQRVTRIVIDTPARRAAVSVESTVTLAGAGAEPNPVEVVFDLDFSDDGTRITQILEFVDTYESTKVLEQMLAKAEGAA